MPYMIRAVSTMPVPVVAITGSARATCLRAVMRIPMTAMTSMGKWDASREAAGRITACTGL